MSVFPKTATFPSFFVVFAIIFLLTILLGLNLKKMLQRLKPMKTQGSTIADTPLLSKQLKELFKMLAMQLSPAILYIGWYLRLLNPYNDYEYRPEAESMILRALEHVILRIPILILRKCIMPEICMPIDQYILFRYRHNRCHNILDYCGCWDYRLSCRARYYWRLSAVGWLISVDWLYQLGFFALAVELFLIYIA
jgi:hypothetical protein